jgi:hypothetical protein
MPIASRLRLRVSCWPTFCLNADLSHKKAPKAQKLISSTRRTRLVRAQRSIFPELRRAISIR